MFDEEKRPARPAHRIGEPLDGLSMAELEELIATLNEEAARVAAELEKKRASGAAAEAFFKKS